MASQEEKGRIFRALHEREEAFIIPNPWDVGSARILEHMGLEALATTSAGYALSAGKLDNTVEREEILEHLRRVSAAVDVPVSADLENGFGDAPEIVAETIRLTAAAGVVGGSIEDMSHDAENPIYEIGFAAERIRAAVEAARALPFVFTLTARAENFIAGRPDLEDTIRRLQAYQEAGADVLYAPGLTKRDEIAAVIAALDRPVNVLVGLKGIELSHAELSAIGVKRLSVGGSLARSALGALIDAAEEMRGLGSFHFAQEAASYKEIAVLIGGTSSDQATS